MQPLPVGHLLALAPAGPDDERLLGRDLVRVGIRRGDAMRVQHAVEHGCRAADLALAVEL